MPDNTIGDFKTMQPGGNATHTASLNPGDILGQYRIVRLLGRGGMGEVYEVEHGVLCRRYALKLLPADFATRPGALERFRREARVMANLDHPNIVKVDEFGQTHSTGSGQAAARHWLRMELAEGVAGSERGARSAERDGRIRSLAEYAEAKGGRLDPDEAEAIFRQVLEGLAHAHASGVVHRDLKPANILLFGAPGSGLLCKISDFGLVRMVGEDWVLSQADQSIRLSMSVGNMPTEIPSGAGTSTRSLIGTYEYMSPEQKRGQEATAASDVYAVGLMMYRLLTGLPELSRKSVSQLVPGAPADWDELIDKAVEPDASLRFPDADAMRAAFKRVASRKSPPPVPMSVPSPTSKVSTAQPAPAPAPQAPLSELHSPPPSSDSAISGPPPEPFVETGPSPGWNRTGLIAPAALVLLALLAVGGVWVWRSRPSTAPSAPPSPPSQSSQQGQSSQPVAIIPPDAGTVPVALEEVRGPVPGQNWTSPSTGMEFVWIAAVNAWVGKYEVTNGEYRRKERGHDSKSHSGHSLNGDRQPVVYVNFDDAKAYAVWLTEQDRKVGRLPDGYRYRLPTEAEWMTFAQCGDGREYPWGNEWPPPSGRAGNYHGQEGAGTWNKISGYNDGFPVAAEVDKLWRNPWGLYGVGGNVWEACTDDADQSWVVWRGASWINSDLDFLRCSCRYVIFASDGDFYGFRVLLSR